MSDTPVRSFRLLAAAIVIAAVIISASIIVVGDFHATSTPRNQTGTTTLAATATSVSTGGAVPNQDCQVFPGDVQPNLFGQQVNPVRQIDLNGSYTTNQLQEATQVALNDSIVKTLTANRTSIDYATFQKVQSGEVDATGGIYAVTTATGYVQNGSSRIPIIGGSDLAEYRLCGTTLYRVWTPRGIVVRVLLSPSLTTTNPFIQGPTLITIGEIDLTVRTILGIHVP